MSSVYDVLLKPVVTEKSTMLQEQGKYVFEVTPTANKIIVKEAIEKAFDVNVLSVSLSGVQSVFVIHPVPFLRGSM